jgi:hypothetical protein
MILVDIFVLLWLIVGLLNLCRGILEITVGLLGCFLLTPVILVLKIRRFLGG